MTKEQIYTMAEDHIAAKHRDTDKMDAAKCETCRRIREEFIAAPSQVVAGTHPLGYVTPAAVAP